MTVYVSYHAIVRWLERVHHLGQDMDHGLPEDASDIDRARCGCALLGITIREARDTICPPRLHAGIAMGARAIRADHGVRFKVVHDVRNNRRVVSTCLSKEMLG